MAAGRIPTTANSPLTAKGDLFSFSTAPARLAVGSNGETLVADNAQATGLKYQAPSDLAFNWITFTPTWTNLTVGNGTSVYKYLKIGKLMYAKYKFTLGSTSAVGTNPNITLPFNPASGAGGFLSYSLKLTDSGVGTFNGAVDEDTNKLYLTSGVTSGSFLNGGTITATSPFTWTTGDSISFDVYYEVA